MWKTTEPSRSLPRCLSDWWYCWWYSSDAAAPSAGREFNLTVWWWQCFQWHAQAHKLTCSPISSTSASSLSWEPSRVCLGDRDSGCVPVASALVLFPACCCLLWHGENVAKWTCLMGWDFGWRVDGKEWKFCWDVTSTHIHLLWNEKLKYRRQTTRYSQGAEDWFGLAFPQKQYSVLKNQPIPASKKEETWMLLLLSSFLWLICLSYLY